MMKGMASYTLSSVQCKNFEYSSRQEWLLANGIGGFAMGTASGVNARRYHGLLVSAVNPPADRMVLLANLEIEIIGDGNPIGLSSNQYVGAVHPEGYQFLERFTVGKFAEWHFRAAGMELLKQVALHQGENVTTIRFENCGKKGYSLVLRPLVSHKFYHANFRMADNYPETVQLQQNRTVIAHHGISLFLDHDGADRSSSVGWYFRFENMREIERGLDPRDDLYCPCELHYHLKPGQSVTLVAADFSGAKANTDWEMDSAEPSLGESLKDAAGKFFVETTERTSILAGYPWFTDWGRDTMISLPGLCLHTGRIAEARQIILDYASQMKQGLIPNRFVEKGEEAEYNTVDATLWFANAIYKILVAEWNDDFAKKAFESLKEVYKHHVKGTLYNIKVDPKDGLLAQGATGVQLTWMDAKVGDWVVTPRHGKPVEINGLWINALRVMEWLAEKLGEDTAAFDKSAVLAESNFDKKFWNQSLGYYLDTAEPDDASLRPNQVVAMALPFSPIPVEHGKLALGKVSEHLLTPVGLRTLSPDSVHYRGRFKGPIIDLDAAYHNGTVWPWLLGSYVSALMRFGGEKADAKRILKHGKTLLDEFGLGGIAEVYDGDEPRGPGGCPWQAWSVAEWLRSWVEDAGGN